MALFQLQDQFVPGQEYGQLLQQQLQQLAQSKIQNMNQLLQQAQTAHGLQTLVPGTTPEQAIALSNLPPALLQPYLKAQAEGPSKALFAQSLNNLFGGQPGIEGQPSAAMQTGQPPSTSGGINVPAGINAQQAVQLAGLGLKKQAAESREKQATRKAGLEEAKFHKEYVVKTKKSAEAAKSANAKYDNIINLARTGKLRGGTTFTALKNLHLENFFRNPETELAQAEIAGLAQNAGAAFNTTRLTNLEVGTYKDSLLTMGNTPEAMITISKNQKLANDAKILKDTTRSKLMKSQPFNPQLEDAVDEAVEPELKRFAQIAQDNVIITSNDPAFADAKSYPKGTIIEVNGQDFTNEGDYWIRV